MITSKPTKPPGEALAVLIKSSWSLNLLLREHQQINAIPSLGLVLVLAGAELISLEHSSKDWKYSWNSWQNQLSSSKVGIRHWQKGPFLFLLGFHFFVCLVCLFVLWSFLVCGCLLFFFPELGKRILERIFLTFIYKHWQFSPKLNPVQSFPGGALKET